MPWSLSDDAVAVGQTPWYLTDDYAASGRQSAHSGMIGHRQRSALAITLDVAHEGTVSFALRVSSEYRYDFLVFYIDGVRQGRWSGEVQAQVSFLVSAGQHTCRYSLLTVPNSALPMRSLRMGGGGHETVYSPMPFPKSQIWDIAPRKNLSSPP